jgi:murein DD-endopeptidase MepM/ murein hydrolase activator NlpD
MGLFASRVRLGLLGIVVCGPIFLNATKFDVLSKEISLLKEMHLIHSIIQDNSLKSGELDGEISSLEYKVDAARRVIKLIRNQEDISKSDVILLSQQLNILKNEKSVALHQYRSILLEEYKNRDYRTKLFFLASSKNLNEFVNRLNHLKTLKDLRKKQLKVLENKQSEVANKLAVYSGNKAENVKLSAMKYCEILKLHELLRLRHQKFSKFNSENNELKLKLNSLDRELDLLTKEVVGKAEEDDNKIDYRDIKLTWPVRSGLLVGRFGVQKHAKERKVSITNNGIDLLVAKDEEVFASGDGIVKAVLNVPGSDTSLIIDHGGFYSVYSNIREVKLKIGDKVNRGDYLALISIDGEGLNKLHFEFWKGTKKVNPELFLEGMLN